MNAGIYLIKNTETSKVYVGSTGNFKTRFYEHKRRLRENRHHSTYLQNSWNKRGEKAFEFIKVEFVEDQKERYIREQWWMDLFQSYDSDYGYNVVKVSELGGAVHQELTKKKISISRKKWHKENPEKSNSRPVKVVDFGTTPFSWKSFPTVKEACKYHGLPDTVTNNYIFRYIDKKAYNDLAFVSSNDGRRYEKLKKMYLRWLKLNNKYNHAPKAFHAYNLRTKQFTTFPSRHQFKKLTGLGISIKNLEMAHKRGDFIVGHSQGVIQQRLVGEG